MEELNCAAKLSVLEGSDPVLLIMQVLLEVKGLSLDKVMEQYQRIKAGEVKVVKVTTSVALAEQQRSLLEVKITQKFPTTELAFAYVTRAEQNYGIEIRIGDDLIEFSFS